MNLETIIQYHEDKIDLEALKIRQIHKFSVPGKIFHFSWTHHNGELRQMIGMLKNFNIETLNFWILACDFEPRQSWRTKEYVPWLNFGLGNNPELLEAKEVDPGDLPLYIGWLHTTSRLSKLLKKGLVPT